MRYKVTVAYDGHRYAGFQKQMNANGIQSVIERALEKIMKQPVSITASGRTDAGVHDETEEVDIQEVVETKTEKTILETFASITDGSIDLITNMPDETFANKMMGDGVMDMVEGSLWKKVFLFALPLGLTGVLQQLFNAADIAVVGQFTGELGAHCMAAVGACTSLISLLVNVFIGISIGSNVVIANAVGANNDKRVKRTCVTSIWVALIGGLFVTLVGELISGPVLKLMGVPAEVFDMANLYIKIYLMGMPLMAWATHVLQWHLQTEANL